MIEVFPFAGLGRFETDWLSARHHFSFGEWVDRQRMGFGTLRVWNDDRVRPGTGFDMHPHRDFEIITYVRTGAVTHTDSLGNSGVTRAGEVQVMSAGTGIVHAEHNVGADDLTLFQIWVRPHTLGVAPRWETRAVGNGAGGLRTLVSGRAGAPEDALFIHQDAALVAGTLVPGETAVHALGPGRHAYLVPASGTVEVDGVAAGPRDGVHVTGVSEIVIRATDAAEVVLVDAP